MIYILWVKYPTHQDSFPMKSFLRQRFPSHCVLIIPIPLKLQPLFDFQPNETKADLNQQTGEVGLMFYYPLIIVQYTICLEKRHWQIILRH